MKKIILCLTIFILAISCEQKKINTTAKSIIVVSIPPLELILKEIVKDNFIIKTMLPAGASPHTHEIVPADFKLLHSATIIFYVSADLDAWICKYPVNSGAKVVKLMDYTKKNSGYLPHNNCNSGGNHTHSQLDPHLWTSPLTIKSITDDIANEICLIDAKNKDKYKENANNFKRKLDSLHKNIEKKFDKTKKDVKLFTAHNSFGYFAREFGLKEFVAIEESPGKEITTKYFLDIVMQIKSSETKCIFSEPQLNSKLIENLAETHNLRVILLDPLNSYIKKDNYFDFISYNAENILIGIGL